MQIHEEHGNRLMSSKERVLWAGGHGVLLLLVLAGIAFVSGYWAILSHSAPLRISSFSMLTVRTTHRRKWPSATALHWWSVGLHTWR